MSTTLFKNCTVGITGMSNTLSDCWNELYDHSDVHSTCGNSTFLRCLYQNLSLHKTGTTTRSKNCNCGINVLLHDKRCAYLSLCGNWPATVAAASISIPPWPGGSTSQPLSELFTPLFQIVDATLNIVKIRCNVVALHCSNIVTCCSTWSTFSFRSSWSLWPSTAVSPPQRKRSPEGPAPSSPGSCQVRQS